jgi:hypothetical protein
VIEQLDMLVRFWELRARHADGDLPLSPGERIELLSLLQLLAAQAEGEARSSHHGPRRSLPGQLTAGTGFLAAEVQELSHDRIVVGAAETVPLGHRTILYIADALSGVEYAVPCQVAWSRHDAPCLIGLTPDGAPSRTTFTAPVPGLWRSPLGIGPTGHRVRA